MFHLALLLLLEKNDVFRDLQNRWRRLVSASHLLFVSVSRRGGRVGSLTKDVYTAPIQRFQIC